MKFFNIDGSIDKELVDRFVEFYNANQSEECTISINTAGGKSYSMELLIFMINQMPKVTMIIINVYSAGFWIAIETTCKKMLSKDAKGMLHYPHTSVEINSKGDMIFLEDKCMKINMKREAKDSEKLAKRVMTEKEYKKFKENEDVYFGVKRLQEIFPEAQFI